MPAQSSSRTTEPSDSHAAEFIFRDSEAARATLAASFRRLAAVPLDQTSLVAVSRLAEPALRPRGLDAFVGSSAAGRDSKNEPTFRSRS